MADPAAVPAPHPDRQAALALAGGDHRGQVDRRPSVAARAVGIEPVVVLEQAGEGAEVDHPPNLSVRWARVISLERLHEAGQFSQHRLRPAAQLDFQGDKARVGGQQLQNGRRRAAGC